VHDVAFPRLNSAAFWFLPGGLIMLCQLVCVDRRYQRMNCFNIREIQGILKRKFFTDLVNTSSNHTLLDTTLITMRHKNNMSNILMYDQSLFYNFDLTNTVKYKLLSSNDVNLYNYSLISKLQSIPSISVVPSFIHLPSVTPILNQIIKDVVMYLHPLVFDSILSLTYTLSYLKCVFTPMWPGLHLLKYDFISSLFGTIKKSDEPIGKDYVLYKSSQLQSTTYKTFSNSIFSDNSSV
jgi:hypothetical protein